MGGARGGRQGRAAAPCAFAFAPACPPLQQKFGGDKVPSGSYTHAEV